MPAIPVEIGDGEQQDRKEKPTDDKTAKHDILSIRTWARWQQTRLDVQRTEDRPGVTREVSRKRRPIRITEADARILIIAFRRFETAPPFRRSASRRVVFRATVSFR